MEQKVGNGHNGRNSSVTRHGKGRELSYLTSFHTTASAWWGQAYSPEEWLLLRSGLRSRASQQDDGGKEVRFWILIPAAAVGC